MATTSRPRWWSRACAGVWRPRRWQASSCGARRPAPITARGCAGSPCRRSSCTAPSDQSALIDLTGRRTAKLIPGCVYKEYPTAGHGLFATHIDQFNGDLLEFVKG
nr:hypothetical protein [Microbispora camponoti]